MALCTKCGTALPSEVKGCPACGARRGHAGGEPEAAVAVFPAMESEITFAQVHLATATTPEIPSNRLPITGRVLGVVAILTILGVLAWRLL
jgi:hypothetical protein